MTDKPAFPNDRIHFDFAHVRAATPDTPSGYEYILVIVDGYSRYVELVPAKSPTAAATVQALLAWFGRYGVANKWTSDQGSHFTAQVVTQLSELLGTAHHFTPAYAPWSNGKVERMNKEVIRTIMAYISETKLQEDQWPTILPVVQFIINNTPTATLADYAPITVFTGRNPSSPVAAIFDGDTRIIVPRAPRDVKQHVQRIQAAIADAVDSIQQIPARATVSSGKPVDFTVGDYVVTARPEVTTRDKTVPHWEGPAVVLEALNDLRYRVRDIASGRERELHARFLKRYADSSLVITPDITATAAHGSRGYEMKRIYGHREQDTGEWRIRVEWAGPPVVSTWEPILNIYQDCPTMVRAYVNRIKKPRVRSTLLALLGTTSPRKRR